MHEFVWSFSKQPHCIFRFPSVDMLCVLSCHISLPHHITITCHKCHVRLSVQKVSCTFGTMIHHEYIVDIQFFIILVLQEDFLQAGLKIGFHVVCKCCICWHISCAVSCSHRESVATLYSDVYKSTRKVKLAL